MNGNFRHGFRDARLTLGWVWPVTSAAAALLAVAALGVLEAQAIGSPSHGRNNQLHLLQGVAFGLVVPLFALALSTRLGGRLEELMRVAWARYGGDRRSYALGRQTWPVLLLAVTGALAGALALGLGRASTDPRLELPLNVTSLWALLGIAGLAALCYVACLGLATLYAGSLGRALFLLTDWLLGSGQSALAVPFPRSHLRSLLGGSPVLGMNGLQAALCLVALTLACTLLYARRVPR